MKIILTGAGSRGDIAPFVALGRALQSRGHEVVLCAAPNFGSWAEKEALPFRPCGRDLQELLKQKADVLLSRPIRLMREAIGILREEFASYMQVIGREANGADLVVGTAGQIAARSAAEAAGANYRCIVYCPIVIPSDQHPPMSIPYRMLPPVVNRLLWTVAGQLMDTALKGTINKRRRLMALDPISDVWAHCLGSRPVLAADPRLGPAPSNVSVPGGLVQTGALLLADDPAPLPPEIESFLAGGPQPIYIGFGSMTDKHPEATSKLLLDAVHASGVRAVISGGWAKLEAGGDPSIIMIGEVPHARLFPRLAVVVHHGGAGTTATAARAGVPQIIIPHLLDQHYWARRVSDLGLGPAAIPRRRLAAKRLAAALRTCTEDVNYRVRAKSFAASMVTDAMERTVRELESIVSGSPLPC